VSYVFPLTLMLAAALSGATYAVFNARKRSRLGCLLGVLTLPVYVVATFRGLMLIDETEAQHVSPSEANRVLCFFRVPSTATDVNCWNSKFGGTRDQADFQIDEPAFLSWIAGLSWEPGEFVTGDDDETKWVDSRRQGREFDMGQVLPVYVTPACSIIDETYDRVRVRNGYYFDTYTPDSPDCGRTVVYDRDARRAYVRFTWF